MISALILWAWVAASGYVLASMMNLVSVEYNHLSNAAKVGIVIGLFIGSTGMAILLCLSFSSSR